jgi:hypothetical protein
VTPGDAARIGAAVARRPSLWAVAVRQWWRTTPSGWWRHRPFLPMPSGDYLRFRLVTQYGSERHRIEPADVLNYLAWCKRQDPIE